jgi:hypothetical protein
VNNDTQQDIIFAYDNSTRIGIELNTGNEAFVYQPVSVISSSYENISLITYVTAADINKDNRKEIIVLGGDYVTVFSNSC